MLFLSMPVWAKDFGVIVDQSPAVSGYGSDAEFEYTGILIPRFSMLIGEQGKFYASIGLNVQNDPLSAVPEILRTEFSWNFSAGDLKLGRVFYSDPLGFVAQGLFDGAMFSTDTKVGAFSAGAFYTGLVYKKRTEISMTTEELDLLYCDLKYSDFADTYFAPKRALLAFGWDIPLIKDLVKMQAGILAQFDFQKTKLHSQYAIVKASMFWKNFIFDLGGCFELLENDGEAGVGLAGEAGVAWLLPTKFSDKLSLLGRFSSGKIADSKMEAFLPLTNDYQGEILKGKFSALSMIKMDYLIKLHETVSVNAAASYFIRSDLGTFTFIGSDGWFLGPEFFVRGIWSPFSDVFVNLGGGLFVPRLGDAAKDSDVLWRIELNLILSFY